MKSKLLLLLLFLVVSSCSKKVLLFNKPSDKVTITIPNNVPSLVFFTTKNENSEHDKIYQRYITAFGKGDYFPILTLTTNEVVFFQNNNKVYFQNNGKEVSGLIISDGKKKPIIEYNPDNYIKSYETYFKIKFNDKVSIQNKLQNLKKEHELKGNQVLNSNFKIDAVYAKKLIANSSSAHYTVVKKKKNSCNSGQVYMYSYCDSLKKKKNEYYSVSKYNSNNQYEETKEYYSKDHQLLTKYYYNAFNLIDSIVSSKITNEGIATSKLFYKYQKNKYSIFTTSNNTTALSYEYDLNSNLECTSMRFYNDGANVVTEKKFKYDDYSRLIEEIQDDKQLLYTYENPTSENYYLLKIIRNNEIVDIKNTIYDKDGYNFIVNQYKGKMNSYSKILLSKNECVSLVYNYDSNNKLKVLYEYVYN